jgi:hypothetical protein
MELKRNREVSLRVWHNEQEIVDQSEDWEVFSNDKEDDTIYIFVKNPKTGKQLKIKVEKTCEIKDEKEEESK